MPQLLQDKNMAVLPQPEFAAGRGSELGCGPVPLDSYRSQQFFESERDRLFAKAWLLVGREEELPKAGDYIVRDVEICRASIIVTRGGDREIRAFHNVCPHRANQLIWDRGGNAKLFICPYHSWSFGGDGVLRGVPDQTMFPGLDKEKCGLAPVTLETWEGWLFVNLDSAPSMSLREYLGSFANYFEGMAYIHAERPVVIETRLKCNWKVVMDAFAEAYHIPTLHKATLKTIFSSTENAHGRPLSTAFHGFHAVNSMYGNPDYAPHERQVVERILYDPAHIDEEYRNALAAFLSHAAVNPTKAKGWSMDVNYLFPNTHIDANVNGFFVHQFWPVSPNETRHEARFYFRTPKTVRERVAQEHMIAHAVDIILEDVSNVERTQRGIESRATDTMQISESEILIRHSLHQIRSWADGAPPSAGDTL